ncbi:MAG: sensor histidine kinase [Nocardioides sp.]
MIGAQRTNVAMGPIEREMFHGAVRYARWLRLGVAVVCIPLGVLAVPTEQIPQTLVATSLSGIWACAIFIAGGERRFGAALLTTDVAVIGAVCLTQVWTVPQDVPHGNTWVYFLAATTVITHQWDQPWRPGLGAAAILVLADVVGVTITGAQPWDDSMASAFWVGVDASLSALALGVIYRGARAADRRIRRTAAARSESIVAAARQQVEREYLTTLHDTACATLLLASTASADSRSVRAQARRDLVTLSAPKTRQGSSDLVGALIEECSYHRLRTTTDLPSTLALPAEVTAAVRQACAEALRNVARHAGVEAVSVRVAAVAGGVLVEITDHGAGFDPNNVGPRHRGLEHSVRGRMRDIGGRATVTSQPAAGTTVRLEWPDATAQR